MSFLAPLYFLAGLAIAGPILFHLIRRQPKGEVEFSSLMFLEPTPPRLTKRSRLENIPLLLLRCAAILLLAFAFARPFLPLAQSDSIEGVQQAVILVIDQSASMKRTGAWEQMKQKAAALLDSVDDKTLIGVVSFDSDARQVLSLEESKGLDSKARVAAAGEAVDQLAPTWFSTDIGQAVRFAADQATLFEVAPSASPDSDEGTAPAAGASLQTRVVLLSDLQEGAKIESLQGYDWPDGVWLEVFPVRPTTNGNVSLKVLPQMTAAEAAKGQSENSSDEIRVQVTQAGDGSVAKFNLRFRGQPTDARLVQIPPGETRFYTLKLPESEPAVTQPQGAEPAGRIEQLARPTGTREATADSATLMVLGDGDDFDNAFHFIRPKRITQQITFLEGETENSASIEARESLAFFLKQIPWSDSTREVRFSPIRTADWDAGVSTASHPLLICNLEQAGERRDELQSYVERGGRLLVVLDSPVTDDQTESLTDLLSDETLTVEEHDNEAFRLISGVDFTSALIAPLSDPGVNDFSNIRIWEHRRLENLGDALNVTLRLDDGSPLLIKRDVPRADTEDPKAAPGKVWVLTTGWQPEQSQFALSTKFVPILLGMLGPNRSIAPDSLVVGDRVGEAGDANGRAVQPGFLRTEDGSTVAVNVAASESETAAFAPERFADFGAVVSSPEARSEDEKIERALRDVELESRQGWWQWLILATLGFVGAETLLAARQSNRSSSSDD